MSKAFNNIVWGLIFATFHINLGTLQMLPSFIGWIMVSTGIRQISRGFGEHKLKVAADFTTLLALLTAFDLIATFCGFSITIPYLFSIIISVIELMYLYQFFQGITAILLHSGKIQLANQNEKMIQGYLGFHVIGCIVMGIAAISYDITIDTFLAIYMIGLRIYITYRMNKTGKLLST